MGGSAILAIQFLRAALGIVPAECSEVPLNGWDAIGFAASLRRTGGTGGDVEPEDLRIRGEGRKILASAPGGKMLPVRRIGPSRIG